MAKITRFLGQFWGQPLKTKDLAFWQAGCNKSAVPRKRLQPDVDSVLACGDNTLRGYVSYVAGGIMSPVTTLVGSPESTHKTPSSGRYQERAYNRGNYRGMCQRQDFGSANGVNRLEPVLPHTHLSLSLSGNVLTWVPYGSQCPNGGGKLIWELLLQHRLKDSAL